MIAYRNPLRSYQQVAAQTASRGQLVLMLFDGAIRFLNRALAGFAEEDPLERNTAIHNNISRTQEIIHELNVSLNMQEGGKFAETMRSLYEYMDRRLLEANLRKEEAPIHEVVARLTVIRDAWSDMLQGKNSLPVHVEPFRTSDLVAV